MGLDEAPSLNLVPQAAQVSMPSDAAEATA